MQLHFDENVSVSPEGALSIDDRVYEDMRTTAAPLASLLGLVTTAVDNPGTGDLGLRFSEGRVVVFYDDSPEYESYVVRWNGGMLIV